MEKDIGEMLQEAGATISDNGDLIDIDSLNEEEILSDKTFENLFAVKDPIERERLHAKYIKRVRELKMSTRIFNSIYKQYEKNSTKSKKNTEGNITSFSNHGYKWRKNDEEVNQLKCGNWIADDTGVYKIEYNNFGQSMKIEASPIPVIPVKRFKNINTQEEKIEIGFFKDKEWNEIIVDKNTIVSKPKILLLANKGLDVNENNAKYLITYLTDVLQLNPIEFTAKKITSHLGWFGDEFVPYSKEYDIEPIEDLRDIRNTILKNMEPKGDYEIWKKTAREIRKNKIVKIMMDTCFASILVPIFGINDFMSYFWVESGAGKSAATLVNASIFGQPDIYTKNFNDTAYSAELMCSFLCNLPFIIDELELDKKTDKNSISTEQYVYMLMQGRGKARGNGKGGLTDVGMWQNTITLNGEESIVDKFTKDGAMNRVIEFRFKGKIIEKDRGPYICNTVRQNYGWAGRDFIEIIQRKLKNKKEELFALQKSFYKELSQMSSFEKQANSLSLILTAGNIVAKEIFKDESLTANDVKEFFRDEKEEVDRAYELIIDWFHQNINKFKEYNDIGEVWGKYNQNNAGDIEEIFINPKVLNDFLKMQGYSWNSLKYKMADRKYILKDCEQKFNHKQKVNGVQGRYVRFVIDNERIAIQEEENYTEKQQEIPFL